VQKNVSINLIADRAAQVRGLQLSIGINWVDEEVRGSQIAVAANISNGPVSGDAGGRGRATPRTATSTASRRPPG
jgi:hypothetical protein